MKLPAWGVPWGPICGAASSKLGMASQGATVTAQSLMKEHPGPHR